MISKIEINNNGLKLVIFNKENKVLVKGKYKDISNEEIDKLLNIIMTWKSEYYSSRGHDGVMFNIKIYYGDKVDEIKGIRKVPSNYRDFDMFVRGIYDR